MQQQQKAIDEMLPKTQKEHLQKNAQEENIELSAFDDVLQPIIDSCTKDSISAGKTWILQYSSEDNKKVKIVLQHLLQRALDEEKFVAKLHLIYLVNDVLHHCARKSAPTLKNELENIVIPMFCCAQLSEWRKNPNFLFENDKKFLFQLQLKRKARNWRNFCRFGSRKGTFLTPV